CPRRPPTPMLCSIEHHAAPPATPPMPFPRKTLLASIALLAPIVVAGIALPVDAAFAQSKKPLAAEGTAPLQSKKPLDERSAATSSGEAIDEEPSDSAADGDAGEAEEA